MFHRSNQSSECFQLVPHRKKPSPSFIMFTTSKHYNGGTDSEIPFESLKSTPMHANAASILRSFDEFWASLLQTFMELETQTRPDFEPESKIVPANKKSRSSTVNENWEFLVKETCRSLRTKQHEDSHIHFEIRIVSKHSRWYSKNSSLTTTL